MKYKIKSIHFCLKKLEMEFQSIKISKFSAGGGGACPQASSLLSAETLHLNGNFYGQNVGQSLTVNTARISTLIL